MLWYRFHIDKEIADFVDWNLFENMTMTWDDFLRHALLMLPFGFMVFEKKIFDYLDQDRMIEDVFLDLAKDKQIVMYQHDGFFHAMDTYKDYEDLNKMWQEGKCPWKIWK